MRLEGSIDAFSLPDIFSLLSMTKKTGGLHLRRNGAHGVVWFTTGAITGGAADVSRQSLVRRLVGVGFVDDDALQAAVERAQSDEIGVGRALQLNGAVDEGVLHDVTAEHIVDSVFDLLRWAEGDFAFVVDEANPDEVGVTRQADEVVVEARRRLDAWADVAATVPSPVTVLSLASSPAEDPELSREDWTLLALVDGRRTVGEIVALLGRGDFAVVSALAELVRRGLLVADGADVVADIARRQSMLAAVEGGGVSVPVQGGEHVSPSQLSAVAEDLRPVDDDADEDQDDDDEFDNGDEAASASLVFSDVEVEDIPIEPPPTKPLTHAVPRPGAHRADVTPARPQAILPVRQPDHPEEPVALAAVAGGAPTTAPAPVIERDPSVNKSLLLRLIAGVRGL